MLITIRQISLIIIFFLPNLALALSLKDGSEAYTNIVETHHRLNNMYFYGAIGLLMVTIPAVGKLRQGDRMRPALSRSLALLIHTVNFTAILFLVIHFMPETESIFDWSLSVFDRIFD